MPYIRERVLAGEFMAGAWLSLGSGITAEIAAITGFDWLLMDQEHSPGDSETLLTQLQAAGQRACAPIVRVVWNEMPRFKRALDLGAMGIMIPYIQTMEEARNAIRYLRYPPDGLRGVAMSTRATGYGDRFDAYFAEANRSLLSVHQIETGRAVQNSGDIAQVDGVDVLFVGPLDLSINVGMPKRFDDPEFRTILDQVARSAKNSGKAAGILLPSVDLIQMVYDMGFTFVAVGSDTGMVATGMRNNMNSLRRYKR